MKWLQNGLWQGFILHVIIPAHYTFYSHVKESQHFSMLESKLWHSETETKHVKNAKMMRFIKTCNHYCHKFNFGNHYCHRFDAA